MRIGLSLLQALLFAFATIANHGPLVPSQGQMMACCGSATSCCCRKEPGKQPTVPSRKACDCTAPVAPEPMTAVLPSAIDVAISEAPVVTELIILPGFEHRDIPVPSESPPSTGPPIFLRHCRILI